MFFVFLQGSSRFLSSSLNPVGTDVDSQKLVDLTFSHPDVSCLTLHCFSRLSGCIVFGLPADATWQVIEEIRSRAVAILLPFGTQDAKHFTALC